MACSWTGKCRSESRAKSLKRAVFQPGWFNRLHRCDSSRIYLEPQTQIYRQWPNLILIQMPCIRSMCFQVISRLV
eukprot:21919_5